MNESQLKNHDFTQKAWKSFYSVIGAPDFQKNDPEAIFTLLKNNLQKIDFSDYLKRYIYKKAEMSGDYKDISIDEYIETIIAQFKDTNTPPSFDKNTTRLSSTVKNWLTRANASRKSVFLLGFGLKMSLFDVNRFLTKGLFQQEINPKDPFEVICGYCYENNLSFYRFERLVEQYFELTPSLQPIESLDSTAKLKRGFEDIKNEKELMDYLSYLKDFSGESRFSRSSKDTFKRLYANAQKIISTEFSKKRNAYNPK